ncbi:MAG: D-alanyl-D-alanine carboxypeptidase family protein [Halarcobacter sp.]
MKRREFLKYSTLHTFLLSQYLHASTKEEKNLFDFFISLFEEKKKIIEEHEEIEPKDGIEPIKKINEISLNQENTQKNVKELVQEIKKTQETNDSKTLENEYIEESDVKPDKEEIALEEKKIIENVYIEDKYLNSFKSVSKKLTDIQRYIGYGNFNLISFDEMLKVPEYSGIKKFTKEEIEFLEYIFYYDPKYHGFFGKRVSHNITDSVDKNEVIKIPHTGHYLYKGNPYETYLRMCDDIGETLVLTSGIRSIVKQSKLFLNKLEKENGNLSITSKSLAPPAFTYHAISDFDVGKKGFGYANFTSRFALTDEFFKMRRLDYIDIRYTIKNLDGVRYEPWHVKVI